MENVNDMLPIMYKMTMNPIALILAAEILKEMKEIEDSDELKRLFTKFPQFESKTKRLYKLLID